MRIQNVFISFILILCIVNPIQAVKFNQKDAQNSLEVQIIQLQINRNDEQLSQEKENIGLYFNYSNYPLELNKASFNIIEIDTEEGQKDLQDYYYSNEQKPEYEIPPVENFDDGERTNQFKVVLLDSKQTDEKEMIDKQFDNNENFYDESQRESVDIQIPELSDVEMELAIPEGEENVLADEPNENQSIQQKNFLDFDGNIESSAQNTIISFNEKKQITFVEEEEAFKIISNLFEESHNVINSEEDNCIVMYSQCNFKGEKLEACKDLGDMKNFKHSIHSIEIPKGFAVTLYDKPNFEGEKHVFQQSQACLKQGLMMSQIRTNAKKNFRGLADSAW